MVGLSVNWRGVLLPLCYAGTMHYGKHLGYFMI